MTVLAHTSVPSWAVPSSRPVVVAGEPDPSGASYLLLGVGAPARPVLDGWERRLAAGGRHVRRLEAADAPSGVTALTTALAEARVGVRVRVAGPVAACLAVRAAAVRAGLEDDELHLAPSATGPIDLFCVHCRTVFPAEAGIDDVVACVGCGRSLLVYHHVARRTGWFLGFQVDAEQAP